MRLNRRLRKISRRTFLGTVAATGASALATPGARASTKAPYRVLYSNDTTNLEYCISPYREAGQRFSAELLEASVDETANTGIDAHFLQPGTGWVPWWSSRTYSAIEHYRWWQDTYREPLCGFAEFMMAGGDMVDVFVRRCRMHRLAPFVSLRLNDTHGLEFANATPEEVTQFYETTPELAWIPQLWSRFYAEHPEYQIDADSWRKEDHLWDWRHPEVRAHKLGFVRELCGNYDIDGLELDFNRDPFFFNVRSTTNGERRRIMTQFLADVRSLLDRAGKGKRLCLRIPNVLDSYDRIGLDLRILGDVGVDMLNVSSSYYTCQNFDLDTIRTQTGAKIAIYLEMTHCTSLGRIVVEKGYDSATFRRTTPRQFRSTANLAYERGADGISFFNFVYYRDHEGSKPELRGPFHEPPFEVIKELRRPGILKHGEHEYFQGNLRTWNRFFPDTGMPYRQLPQQPSPGSPAQFVLDIALPPNSHTRHARLQIQLETPQLDAAWRASVNGSALGPGSPAMPEDEPFRTLINGTRDTLREWRFHASQLRDGPNRISISMRGEGAPKLIFLRLVLERPGN